jgi:hypothetical protein
MGTVIVTSGQRAFAEISASGVNKRFRRTRTNANERHHSTGWGSLVRAQYRP